ncbi:hypothetical protein GPALN_002207 [Globodera pallida]|nr:hypothetical protein GPALN_002207 [Globodera pallida]
MFNLSITKMSERPCFVCNTPVLNNLAMLCKCNHVAGHATCVTPFVTQHGRCPVPNCAQPAVESDVLVLCIDPPQPSCFGQNDQRSVREVIGVIRQRLVGHPQNANASENDFEEVANIFDNLISRPMLNAPPGSDKVVDDRLEKLKALLKTACPIVGFVVLGLLCWYYAPLLAAAGGSLSESFTSLVMGLAPLLRKYFSEIVVSGSVAAFFSAFAFGKKKIVD